MSEASPENSGGRTLLVDLGKKKRKQVRRLRKGRGKLTSKVNDLIADMTASGEISADSDTVIVVVEKKRSNRLW